MSDKKIDLDNTAPIDSMASSRRYSASIIEESKIADIDDPPINQGLLAKLVRKVTPMRKSRKEMKEDENTVVNFLSPTVAAPNSVITINKDQISFVTAALHE